MTTNESDISDWGFFCEIDTGVVYDRPYFFQDLEMTFKPPPQKHHQQEQQQEQKRQPEQYQQQQYQQQQYYPPPNRVHNLGGHSPILDACAVVAMSVFVFLL